MKFIAFIFVALLGSHAFAGTVWCEGKTDYEGLVRKLMVTFEAGGKTTRVNVYDISSDFETWLAYDIAEHELIGDGHLALVTLDVNEKESGLGPVNHADWELKFQFVLIPNQDPQFLQEFQGRFAGQPIAPAWLNCEVR